MAGKFLGRKSVLERLFKHLKGESSLGTLMVAQAAKSSGPRCFNCCLSLCAMFSGKWHLLQFGSFGKENTMLRKRFAHLLKRELKHLQQSSRHGS